MSDVLLVEKKEGIATLTLNRPKAMNALSRELRGAIAKTFRDLKEDEDVRVAILTGAGKAFCAGLDLKEMSEGRAPASDSAADVGLMESIRDFDRPIIGGINGFAITGGFELALACDVLIASSEARFADTHARVGIMPGWGLSQKLSRAIGISRAKELSLTGNYLSAEQANAWGLVNRVVAPDQLMPACRALAEDMLSCVPEVQRLYLRVIDEGFAASFGDGMKIEAKNAREQAHLVTAEKIAERREKVQARGRNQSN